MVKIKKISLIGFQPFEFFSKLGSREKNASYFTSGEWVIIAWNPKRTVRSKNTKIFGALKKEQSKRSLRMKSALPFLGGAIGFLDYDVEKKGGIFHVYDKALLWDGKKLLAIGDRKYAEEVYEIQSRAPLSPSASALPARTYSFGTGGGEGLGVRWTPSISRSEYGKAFKKIQRDIRHGEYYQLNLTYRLYAESSTDHRRLFCALARRNPASGTSYFEDGDFALLSLSPERFVTIEGDRIVTCPIKGTRPRGKNPREDVKFKNELLKSEKEAAELNMITDLLRNDIGKVSLQGSVKVTGHRLLQKNPSVWHTYSVIEGRLQPKIHPVDALQSMFPGGSVTGCPKRAAVERIDELETEERGPYCGSMAMLSRSGFLDSTILIRTIVAKGSRLSLGVGGGIVADSREQEEWEETQQKAKAFSGTLGLT